MDVILDCAPQLATAGASFTALVALLSTLFTD